MVELQNDLRGDVDGRAGWDGMLWSVVTVVAQFSLRSVVLWSRCCGAVVLWIPDNPDSGELRDS